jgi:hypothetical protein
MILRMYSESTNTVDCHMIIRLSSFIVCIFIFFQQIDLYFLYSVLLVDIFIIFFALFFGLLRAYPPHIIWQILLACY